MTTTFTSADDFSDLTPDDVFDLSESDDGTDPVLDAEIRAAQAVARAEVTEAHADAREREAAQFTAQQWADAV